MGLLVSDISEEQPIPSTDSQVDILRVQASPAVANIGKSTGKARGTRELPLPQTSASCRAVLSAVQTGVAAIAAAVAANSFLSRRCGSSPAKALNLMAFEGGANERTQGVSSSGMKEESMPSQDPVTCSVAEFGCEIQGDELQAARVLLGIHAVFFRPGLRAQGTC